MRRSASSSRDSSSRPCSTGDLGRLYGAYRAELDRLALTDRELVRARAATRLTDDLGAWHGEPVFAYGFEDLTAAQWSLLEALAGRAELTVSLPYEPARPAFASLRRTVEDLAALADGRIEELPPLHAEVAHPALAHLERTLFDDSPPSPTVELEGAIRFFEGAGVRGALELVGEEVLGLLRAGTAPEQIGLVCPSLERWRAPVETAFGTLGIPYAFEAPLPLASTSYGHALLSLLRYAWLGGDRRGELFAYLRSPYSGVPRHNVDFVEGRLRGRAIAARERVEETVEELRPGVLEPVHRLRQEEPALEAVRELATAMLRAAHGLESPPVGEAARLDLRAHEACVRLLDELAGWERLTEEVLPREDVLAALEKTSVRGASPNEPGRVAVVDLLRARTRRFEAVFMLGLEEGSLPRRGQVSPFLDDDERHRLGARLERPDQVSRDRYLFYTACVRATRRLYLVREAAGDEGSPREPSPFWEEVTAVFEPDDVARWTRRRALSELTWPLEEAPSERERLRALALLASDGEGADTADALARANGWERRLERARRAFTRDTRLRHPAVLAQLGARTTFNVTELERFADCSSAWLFDRVIDPKTIDAEVDAKLRGQVAHTALHRFYARLPKELGAEQVPEERVDDAIRLMRTCLDEALGGVRMDTTELQRRELGEGLWRDLEQVVRDEARSEVPLVPRRFEVSFGSERSPQELQRGLDLGEGLSLSGKIDRIDLDPFSARGIVQDYKAGKYAHSAREIERELRLQIPLYMLVLARPRRRRASGRRLPSARGRPQGARSAPCRRARGRAARLRQQRLPRRRRLLGSGRGREGQGAGAGGAHRTRRRPARPQGRRVSRVVRPLADVPGAAGMTAAGRAPNPEQAAAIAARGDVFLSAGAGTGKTSVLVERFAAAVCDEGLDVESVLVITYTKRAAAELRARIREALRERGRFELARALDGAWISTIHGFCNRLLKTYPFQAGLDPRFRELDEAQAAVIRGEAFDEALDRFCAGGRPRAAAPARDVPRGRPAPDADRRVRDAARRRPPTGARAR